MGLFNRKEALAGTPKEVLNRRLYWSVAVFGKFYLIESLELERLLHEDSILTTWTIQVSSAQAEGSTKV
jgi:hypothetical protein